MPEWNKLVFGSYSAEEIAEAVKDEEWQAFRETLKGKSLEEKFKELVDWMKKHKQANKAKIQVTNYVNALARSGDVTLAMCPAGWEWSEDDGKCVPKMALSADEGNRNLHMDDAIAKSTPIPTEEMHTIETDLSKIIAGLNDAEKAKILDKYGEEFAYFEMDGDTKRMLPFPNEHACRLQDPSKFDTFRRTSRNHNGKLYDVIWGIKDGKVEQQAFRYPKAIWSTEQAKTHCKSHGGISFEPAKNPSLTMWENIDPKDMYVLSWEAMENDDIPPEGVSGIPIEMEPTIAERFRWWTFSDERVRLQVRLAYKDALGTLVTILQKYDDGRYLIECSIGLQFLVKIHKTEFDEKTLTMADVSEKVPVEKLRTEYFTLMHHFWRINKPVDGETTKQHWDIFIGGKQIICVDNPIKQRTFAIMRKPYSIGFSSKGMGDYEYVEPGSPGNPTSNIPSWVKQLDAGEATIIDECSEHMLVWMRGSRLNGRYLFTFDKKKNVWEIKKDEQTSVKLSMALGADETTHKTSIHMQLSKFYMKGKDMVVEGTALSYGVWNGEYFTEEAIMDRPERVMGIPIAVGSHATKKNSGEVIEHKATDGSIWIRGIIPGEFQMEQERVLSGEFVGFSVEVDVLADEKRRIIKKILGYDRVVLVDMPACVVCTLDKARAA